VKEGEVTKERGQRTHSLKRLGEELLYHVGGKLKPAYLGRKFGGDIVLVYMVNSAQKRN